MRIARTMEGICGVLAGVAGLMALGVGFWAPINSTCESTTVSGGATETCSHISYVAANGITPVLPILVGFTTVFVAVALGAALHGWRGARLGREILWVATALLAFGNFLTILDMGVFLLPSTLLAASASVLALAGRRRAAGLAAG